jgi:hypothetical protein
VEMYARAFIILLLIILKIENKAKYLTVGEVEEKLNKLRLIHILRM